MVEETDVFVIGGGPAGLAAAIATRRKGFRVTVADGSEPPIDKACGEGLLTDTAIAFRELGGAMVGISGGLLGRARAGLRDASGGGRNRGSDDFTRGRRGTYSDGSGISTVGEEA